MVSSTKLGKHLEIFTKNGRIQKDALPGWLREASSSLLCIKQLPTLQEPFLCKDCEERREHGRSNSCNAGMCQLACWNELSEYNSLTSEGHWK